MSRQKKVILNESEMPTHWYNITPTCRPRGLNFRRRCIRAPVSRLGQRTWRPFFRCR